MLGTTLTLHAPLDGWYGGAWGGVEGPGLSCSMQYSWPAMIPGHGSSVGHRDGGRWRGPTGAPLVPRVVPLVPCVIPLVPRVAPLVPCVVPLVPRVVPLVPCVVPLVPCVVPLVPCEGILWGVHEKRLGIP